MNSSKDKLSRKLFKSTRGITMINLMFIIVLIIVLVTVSVCVVYTISDKKVKNNDSHLVEENVLNNKEVKEDDAVAKIQEKYYITLQEAIDETSDDGTENIIEVMSNVSENLLITENKNIVLELNNHMINNSEKSESTITVKGNLKIRNGNVTGEYISAVATINVIENAKLQLSSTNIDRMSSDENAHETIELHGGLDMDSGKIISNNSNAIFTYTNSKTDVSISGTAEIHTTNHPALYNRGKGKLTISGGTITSESSDAINNQIEGSITITGGKITSESGKPINNYGTLEISGTTEISSTNRPTVYNQSEGNLTITGGTISAQSGNTIMNQNKGILTITGGKISSESGNAINNIGTLSISDLAEIFSNGDKSPTIYNHKEGNVTITGGSISNKSANYDVYNDQGSVVDEENIIIKKNWSN